MTIFDKYLLTFDIGNNRVVENIFSARINPDLQKSNHLLKIG